ncbi:MAG: 50S ribosomal protein L25 [Deltaproteobacteria bacterium]|nr:50S ribosomal protein L25/general stress protein Ctc [Deltaproteobacteria bacterium]RLA90136.1 MAG: 50S ribosomal protein L25 [Deltaproteobacteria bacterium]
MENIVIEATIREKTGKEANRKIRKQGLIPAIFYGKYTENIPLNVDAKSLYKLLSKSSALNVIFDLRIKQDGKFLEKKVMLKDYQIDPIKRECLHADFYEVKMDQKLRVRVPIVVVGKSVGVEKGGILELLRREIEVECLPQYMPDKIEVDVSNLDFSQSIHAKELKLENVEVIADTNFAIVTVIPPAVEEVAEEKEEEEEEEGKEKEVEKEPSSSSE